MSCFVVEAPSGHWTSTDVSQLADSAGGYPFDHENVALAVVARIVWMNETANWPQFGLAAQRHLAAAKHLVRPSLIVAQMRDDLVVGIENRDASVQVGHK